jgi:hypothetical protein
MSTLYKKCKYCGKDGIGRCSEIMYWGGGSEICGCNCHKEANAVNLINDNFFEPQASSSSSSSSSFNPSQIVSSFLRQAVPKVSSSLSNNNLLHSQT